MRVLNEFPNDAIALLLSDIQVGSTMYCLSELGAPWGFLVEGRNVARFHLLLEGSAVLEIDGESNWN